MYIFPSHNLNCYWRWRWWDPIQAIFLNLFFTFSVFISSAFACCIYTAYSACQALLESTIAWITFPKLLLKVWPFFVCILYIKEHYIAPILEWKPKLQLQNWMKSSLGLLLSISWMHNVDISVWPKLGFSIRNQNQCSVLVLV